MQHCRARRYDIGATSGALVSMTSEQFSGTDWYSLSAFQSGLVVSLSLFGALLGSGAALLYGDKLGRRRELLGASALYGGCQGAVGGCQKRRVAEPYRAEPHALDPSLLLPPVQAPPR